MTRDIRVSEAFFQRAAGLFDSGQTTELAATIASHNVVSRFLEAVLVDHD
jgi:hypothetical protein